MLRQMHRRTALVAVVPVLLLTGACTSTRSDTPPDRVAAPIAKPAAAPTTDPAVLARRHAYEGIATELQQDLQQAHVPDDFADNGPNDTKNYCSVSLLRLFPDTAHGRYREKVVALLRTQGWKDGVTSGSDESHMTRDGWELFVSRTTGISGDDGKSYQRLTASASCS
jgi:hypothetical protein